MMKFLVLIWLKPNTKGLLQNYENQILPILERHGGSFINIWSPQMNREMAGDLLGGVSEIHELKFTSQEAFTAFRTDPELKKHGALRETAVEKVVFLPVEAVDLKSYFQRK